MGGTGAAGERGKGVCARWTGCERAAARARGEVCLGGETRGQAGRRQLSRGELGESGARRVPVRSARSETLSAPRSPGRPGSACGRGIADWSRDARGPSRTVHPGEVAPTRVGRREARAESHPHRPLPVRPEPRGGRQPDAGSCSLFWEVPRASRAAAAKPGGGEGAGAAAGRTDARCKAARPGSVPEPGRWEARVTGTEVLKLCRSFPSFGKGRERLEVLASGGNVG